ncbi:phosphatase PAP2 family protein [Nocardioides mesophilus]|uniref:phosphatase PAP2 family protein n=1 Tax=Nocardioides mesophilus TaxID=433659 RepID=UPI001FE2FB26|nr:phosphatase PAP2 family protein [Nocardioides mesophilus]
MLLAAPFLPRSVNAATVTVAAVCAWVRVRQGAHFPIDAVGGVLLGATVAATLTAVLAEPISPRRGR